MNRQSARLSAGFAASLMALASVVCGAAASAQTANDVVITSSGDGQQLSLPGSGAFHVTGDRVEHARVIAVPGSSARLILWNEVGAQDDRLPHYAISLDGESAAGRVRTTSYEIKLRYAAFDPLAMLPGVNQALRADATDDLSLVQCWTPPLEAMQSAIESAGGRVLRHLANHTMIVRLPGEARAQVQAMPFVRWVGPFHPAYKLDQTIHSALAMGLPEQLSGRYSIEAFERGPNQQGAIARAINSMGGRVHVTNPRGYRMEATLTLDQLTKVARLNEVHFIDPWGPGGADMDIVRSFVGADYIETNLGLSGEDVRGEIFDTGLDLLHPEWKHPPLLHSTTSGGSTLHGTSTFGICYAQGLSGPHKGLLPEGQGVFFSYNECSQFGGAKPLHDILSELIDPLGSPYRAVFFTSSVGGPRTLEYTTISAETDDAIFLNQIMVTWTNGNSGNPNSRPQSWAKNLASVGGVMHGNSPDPLNHYWGNGASTGPANDGRIQPHFILFYDSIRTTTSAGGYTQFGGSSASTPAVAGTFGLLMQMWHEGVWEGHGGGAGVFESRPKPMTARALMANTAFRYDWTLGGLNADIGRDVQGWGVPDLEAAHVLSDATTIIDETDLLEPLQTQTYDVEVLSGTPVLSATMSYIDVMGTTSATQHRINDLSLRLISPTGIEYWGNHETRSGNFTPPGGISNTLDTMESVFIRDPEPGDWRVEVIADELLQDTHLETPELDADFALVVTGIAEADCLADCTGDGVLDIFDFLCFQNAFVAAQTYACDCDTSTGNGVCDIFDFLCFQNAFAAGCP